MKLSQRLTRACHRAGKHLVEGVGTFLVMYERDSTADTPSSETGCARPGKIRYGCALWLLGLPLPIIIIALFYRGCDW